VASELGEFLRSRRHRLSPDRPGGRRRTPGLRREEVAAAANVSLSYYTWLEQGREQTPSVQVLESIADALRLNAAERLHVLALAGHPPPAEARYSTEVGEEILGLLAALEPHPAHVVTRCLDVLAWNKAAEELFGAPFDPPPHRLNAVRLMFLEPVMRERMPEWEDEARWLAGLLRGDIGHQLGNPRFREVVDELIERSPEFRAFWEAYDVQRPAPRMRRFRLASGEEIALTYVRLAIENDPDKSVVVHY
jgi:transcriptional regulator with XRE-family HTH domain